MTKTTFSKTLLATSLIACTTLAQAELSGNVALTTDYIWRGVSQTLEDPAIQGGLDFSNKSGIYLGVWGSNVNYGGDEHMELDIYGGWAGEMGGIGIDVGAIRYSYFDDTGVNFTELYFGISKGIFSAKISNDFDNENLYIEAGLEFALPEKATLAVHVGSYNFDAGTDYVDYSIGVSKEFAGIGIDLSYYDTDISGSDGTVVLTFSKSL